MTDHVKTIIIGAGLAGIGMGIRLKDEGDTAFVILEKESRAGGVWRDNTYPGAACDVQSHLYWFSFDDQPDWSRIYPLQPEILANIERLVARHGILPHIRFNAELQQAAWDDDAQIWRLHLTDGTTLSADTLITAWGQLNTPSNGGIKGVEDFAGDWFHSARWNHDLPLEGRRVASIGSGPSAAQFIPELAKVAGHLTVFQRSPNYVLPRLDRAYTPEERQAFLDDPSLMYANREGYYRDHESWHGAMRLGTETADTFSAVARTQLETQIEDEALRARLWPDYPVGCKRLMITDDFLPAISQPNVSLVTDRIDRIEARGVRMADGTLHEMDVLVYGTGFDSQDFLGVADITGRGGCSLRERWQDYPEAYLGITVAGFPNFFMLYGPNTNLGHNSILLMLECQFAYVQQAMHAVAANGGRPLEVKPEALTRFNVRLQEELRGSSWAGSCISWYKTAENRITNNWSGSVEDYKAQTKVLAMDDYIFLDRAKQKSNHPASAMLDSVND